MGTVATVGSGQAFRRVPAGSHVARCVQVVDLGHQEIEYQGETKTQHKVLLTWEVFGEDDSGVPLTTEVNGVEVPMTIGKKYTLSLNERATLRHDLDSWRGRPFTKEDLAGWDVKNVLGAYALLNVVEAVSPKTGKTYSNVSSVGTVPKGLPKPESKTALVYFDAENPDMKLFDAMPEWLQDLIKSSSEWQARAAKVVPAGQAKPPAKVPFDDVDDDIPF